MACAYPPATTAEVLVSFFLRNLDRNDFIDRKQLRKELQLLDDDHPVMVAMQQFYENYRGDPMTEELHAMYRERFAFCDLDEPSQEQFLNMIWQEQLADGQNINWNTILTVVLIINALITEANKNWEQERIEEYIHWTLILFDEFCIDILLENNGGWEALSEEGQQQEFKTPWNQIAAYSPCYSPTSRKRKVTSKRPITVSDKLRSLLPPRQRTQPKPSSARALDFSQSVLPPGPPTASDLNAPSKPRTRKHPATPERRKLMDELSMKSLEYTDESSSSRSLKHSTPKNVPLPRNPNLPLPNLDYFSASSLSSGSFPSFTAEPPPALQTGLQTQRSPESDASGSHAPDTPSYSPYSPPGAARGGEKRAQFFQPGDSDLLNLADFPSHQFENLTFLEASQQQQPPPSSLKSPSAQSSPMRPQHSLLPPQS